MHGPGCASSGIGKSCVNTGMEIVFVRERDNH